jgi:xylulokinase
VHEGEALLKLGGSMDILVVSDEIFLDSRLYLDRHPISGKWIPNGCTATSGSLLRWEQSIFDHVALDELDHAAAMSQPGALLALPFFLGEKTPLHDPDLRGGLLGLNLTTTRGDIHRSFLEGIAYSARLHFEVFKDRGLDLRSIRITNGGSKSRLWREILANVLNRDLTSVIDHPGASYAAAVIAGIGTGLITDWSYVISGLEEGETISPNLDYVALYDERYHQYLEFSDVTTDISHALVRDVRTD